MNTTIVIHRTGYDFAGARLVMGEDGVRIERGTRNVVAHELDLPEAAIRALHALGHFLAASDAFLDGKLPGRNLSHHLCSALDVPVELTLRDLAVHAPPAEVEPEAPEADIDHGAVETLPPWAIDHEDARRLAPAPDAPVKDWRAIQARLNETARTNPEICRGDIRIEEPGLARKEFGELVEEMVKASHPAAEDLAAAVGAETRDLPLFEAAKGSETTQLQALQEARKAVRIRRKGLGSRIARRKFMEAWTEADGVVLRMMDLTGRSNSWVHQWAKHYGLKPRKVVDRKPAQIPENEWRDAFAATGTAPGVARRLGIPVTSAYPHLKRYGLLPAMH